MSASKNSEPFLPFGQSIPPNIEIIKRISDNTYAVNSIINRLANQGNIGAQIQFGGQISIPADKVIFNLNNAEQCYALLQNIIALGNKNKTACYCTFTTPRFIIFPNTHKFQNQGGKTGIEFSGTNAQGAEKRMIFPSMDATKETYEKAKKGLLVIAGSSFSLTFSKELGETTFTLHAHNPHHYTNAIIKDSMAYGKAIRFKL